MRSRIIFLILFTGCFFTLTAQEAGEGIKFMANEPWEQFLQQARQQERLIFMDCYTEWCGPCKGLAQNIFPLKEVGDYFNAHFVNTQYDMEKGEGKILYNKYKEYIVGFPTLLLINASGEVVHQMAGYQEADALIAGMKAGQEGKSLAATRARFEAGERDIETGAAYVNALTGAYQLEKIPGVVQAYLATIPVSRLLEPDVWKLVEKQIKDPYSEQYRFVLENLRTYQYRLKVDRYALESQLSTGMSRAINAVVETSRATRDPDTLLLVKERAGQLKELLTLATIKGFPTHLAKLEVNDLILAGKPVEAYRLIETARGFGLLPSENLFLAESYRYIIENVKDKKLVRACLDKTHAIQAKQNSDSPLSYNFYDVIAIGHEKLKERNEAAAATAEYERRQAIKLEYAKKIFGGKNEEKEN